MNMLSKTFPILAAMSLASGCVGGDDTDTGGGTETSADDGMTATMTAATMTMTTMEDDSTGGTVGMTGDSTVGPDTDTMTEGSSESTGPDPTIPEFNDTAFEDYVRVDRKGFPAINTGLNLAGGDKDAYNGADPVDDATDAQDGVVPDIEASLNALHRGLPGMQTAGNTGLDDDLGPGGVGLDVCVPPQAAMDDCITQAGPFAIPDTININTANPAQFPNGRQLNEPVMDIILAVLLLDLDGTGGAATITTFLDLNGDGTLGDSLNPIANDVAFEAAFPYLAAPN